jgi:preprotein translocase subunit SecD
VRRRGLIVSVVAVCCVCFGVLGGVLAAGWSPALGLDLAGGLSVVYKPAHPVPAATLDTVVAIMDNRVNALGVSQPNIGTQGGDVVADLPGIKNAQHALAIIGETAELYFRPVLCAALPYTPPTTKTKTAGTKTTSATSPALPTSCPSAYAYSSADYDTASASFNAPGPDPALSAYKTTPPGKDDPHKTVLLPIATNGTVNASSDRYLLGPSEASGTIISSAFAQLSSTGQWQVAFKLTGPGSTIFNDIATKNYHTLVAADLDGVVESAPVIDATNFNGQGEISGNFTHQEASSLALVLQYGALPVRLVEQTATTVSPSLGKSALRAGLLAGILGLLLVMGYMIFYYRALGVVVVFGLVTTAAFLFGLISILGHISFGLTLDLSGVVGLIVSVGITVDSYVVYFERLKDEVRAGRSIRTSVDRSFRSAFRTILSADAVSFIGALVLWILSVGAVRGFAFFLGISTVVDVFTAYFFTRPLVILLGQNRVFTEARGLGIARGLASSTEGQGSGRATPAGATGAAR